MIHYISITWHFFGTPLFIQKESEGSCWPRGSLEFRKQRLWTVWKIGPIIMF